MSSRSKPKQKQSHCSVIQYANINVNGVLTCLLSLWPAAIFWVCRSLIDSSLIRSYLGQGNQAWVVSPTFFLYPFLPSSPFPLHPFPSPPTAHPITNPQQSSFLSAHLTNSFILQPLLSYPSISTCWKMDGVGTTLDTWHPRCQEQQRGQKPLLELMYMSSMEGKPVVYIIMTST